MILALLLAASPVDELLDGVDRIASPGVPGAIVVFGEDAFAIGTGGAGDDLRDAVVAGASWGRGRVVAFGHGGFLGAFNHPGTARLLVNAVRWAGRRDAPVVGLVNQSGFRAYLEEGGFAARDLDAGSWRDDLGDVSVLVGDIELAYTPEEREAVTRFVSAGGGLLLASCAWGWRQVNGYPPIDQHPGNLLLLPAGVMWADRTVNDTAADGFAVERERIEGCHARWALDHLGDAQTAHTLTRAALDLPLDEPTLMRALQQLLRRNEGNIDIRSDRPMGVDRALDRVLTALQVRILDALTPDRVPAHPSAEAFPGPIEGRSRAVTREITIQSSCAQWVSTGLYAPAGGVVRIEIPPAAVEMGLQVRIGAHIDETWHLESWERVPRITLQRPLDAPEVPIAGAFGGPVYIVTPDAPCGPVEVRIRGGVEAPRFVLGSTTAAEWREGRAAPAPWAELETDRVILTVPSRVVRDLEDPEALLQFWNSAVDAQTWLSGRAAPARPERYVCDVQISAGYMHSGYPIMTHMDVEATLVTLADLQAGNWGLWHELGHNRQDSMWTFDGTGEVTNNVFCMHTLETVCGGRGIHEAIAPDTRAQALRDHLAAGAPFDRWKQEPFLALILYMQLKEAFGWEAFRDVFAEYAALPERDRPETDDEKRDQWMVRFSRRVGRNLGPFFQAWGVPTSQSARDSIESLPDWMPEDWPR